MNSQEGMRRIAKAIALLGCGWAAIAGVLGLGVLVFGAADRYASIGLFIAAAIGWGIAKGISWVISGFGAPSS